VTTSHDLEEISALAVRYASGVDRRDWDHLRGAFTEDVVADYPGVGFWSGLDDFVTFLDTYHKDMGLSVHHVGNVVADVDGDHGTARSYVTAVLQLDREHPDQVLRADGFYDDVLVRTPAGWRISRRTATIVAATVHQSQAVAPSEV
jgi:3-phenylpropionate/cinnamic acid dioxygenase small subunit